MKPPHAPPRVIELIKNDVRKYLKRERRKPLPEEADYWDFHCRVGRDASTAEPVHVAELIAAIDRVAAERPEEVYVEVLAKPAQRGGQSGVD